MFTQIHILSQLKQLLINWEKNMEGESLSNKLHDTCSSLMTVQSVEFINGDTLIFLISSTLYVVRWFSKHLETSYKSNSVTFLITKGRSLITSNLCVCVCVDMALSE